MALSYTLFIGFFGLDIPFRIIYNVIMFDIVFVGTNEEQFNKLKQKVFIAKKADSVEKAQQISLTK